MFAAASATLRRGGGLLVFPEGTSHADPTLRPLRTGAARIALGAARGAPQAPGVTILPVGLVFDAPGTFRGGRAFVRIGPPIPTGDLVAQAATDEEEAVRALTERIAAALRRQMLQAEDRETLRLAALVDALWRGDAPASVDGPADVAGRQAVLRAARYLGERDPQRLEAFRHALEAYARDVAAVGDIPHRYAPGAVVRYALRESGALLVGWPLALVGAVINFIPYRLTGLTTRWFAPEDDMVATFKLGTGVVIFPVCWFVEADIILALGGLIAALVFLLVRIPTAFVALAWQERLARIRRDARGWWQFLRRRDVHEHLVARRAALLAELRALATAAPDEVLDGTVVS